MYLFCSLNNCFLMNVFLPALFVNIQFIPGGPYLWSQSDIDLTVRVGQAKTMEFMRALLCIRVMFMQKNWWNGICFYQNASRFKSMLITQDFLTWLLIGWLLHAASQSEPMSEKSWVTKMEFKWSFLTEGQWLSVLYLTPKWSVGQTLNWPVKLDSYGVTAIITFLECLLRIPMTAFPTLFIICAVR